MSAIKILKLKILKDDKHGKFKKENAGNAEEAYRQKQVLDQY